MGVCLGSRGGGGEEEEEEEGNSLSTAATRCRMEQLPPALARLVGRREALNNWVPEKEGARSLGGAAWPEDVWNLKWDPDRRQKGQ